MPKKSPPPRLKKILAWGGSFLALIVVIIASYTAYLYAQSPSVIRNPYLQHYHFRLQILVDGKAEDFSSAKYQTAESKISCTAALPAEPIHFHDNKDQIVHIHWDGMTGGLLLKDYGWNYIGGLNGVLGYRFDHLPHIKKVLIHGYVLSAVPKGDNFYVYTGDEQAYKERPFNDFLKQDFEAFFHHPSNLPSSKPTVGLLDWLQPKAHAHEMAAASGLAKPQLEQLNNLIGSAVIFVQKTNPTDAQVKDRFNHLEPLSTSVCGG